MGKIEIRKINTSFLQVLLKPKSETRYEKSQSRFTNNGIKESATQALDKIKTKVQRWLNSNPDRYGYFFSEVTLIIICITWIFIEYWLKWPTAFGLVTGKIARPALVVVSSSAAQNLFNLFTLFYPYCELSIMWFGAASLALTGIKYIHNLAKRNFIQDLNKITIEEREEKINNGIKNEEKMIQAEELTDEELIDIYKFLLLVEVDTNGQTD